MKCRKSSAMVAIVGLGIGGAALCVGCEDEHGGSGYYQFQHEKAADTGKDYDARYGVTPPASGTPYTDPDTKRDAVTPPSNLPPNNLPPSQIPPRQP